MTLRRACYRLFTGLLAVAILSFGTGALARAGLVLAGAYAVACVWRCDHLGARGGAMVARDAPGACNSVPRA